MNYSKKDIIIGFGIIILIVIAVLYYKKTQVEKIVSTSSPVSIDFKQSFKDSFKYDIPEDIDSIELKGEGSGIATNKEILADVENPNLGYFYEAWLEDSDTKTLISLGKLVEGKGGWMIEFPPISNTQGKRIIVSLEKKFDKEIEKTVLEGTFN